MTSVLEPSLVLVESGKFLMGCTAEQQQDCLSDEEPAIRRKMHRFYLGKYEVTNRQFAQFLSSAGNQEEGGSLWYNEDKYTQLIKQANGTYVPKPGTEQYPVASVNWYGAKAYTEWLTEQTQKPYRLPTEAEWEYAARGGRLSKGYRYSGSDSIGEVAWYYGGAENSGTGWGFKQDYGSHPVGQKAPNELGIYDMSGNLKEWCTAVYAPHYGDTPASSSYTVLRGGSWDNGIEDQRVSAREPATYTSGFGVNKGFRVAMDLDLTSALDTLAKDKGFSGTLLVLKQGKKLYLKSFGMANRETGRLNANDSQYLIASITKLFTSVLTLQLVEQGLINLNAPISSYLPNYPDHVGSKIRVKYLLNHTSGLENTDLINPDQEDIPPMYSDDVVIDELIRKYCSSSTGHDPGTNYDYNNADYVLLGKIIENVTGETYREVLQKRILSVLDLEYTGLLSSAAAPHPTVAQGYRWDRKEKTYQKNPDIRYENYYAAGAMYANAEDLGVFTRAIYDGTLLQETSIRQLTTTQPITRGYGMGLWVDYPRYNKVVTEVTNRYGRIWGHNTLITQFLEEDISVIVLANTNRVSVGNFQERVGELLLE